MNNSNELSVDSRNQFFSNNEIPYCLKAGAIAVLSHATIDYHTKDGQDAFMAMFFDKDINAEGKSKRIITGTMSFTFGVPSSMGEDNCLASIKKFVELYPSVGDVLEHIADNTLTMPDDKVCEILAEASAKRFVFSPEGSVKNCEKYVSPNFDTFKKQAQSHYPGMIPMNVYENVKRLFEDACKKKTITATPSQMA